MSGLGDAEMLNENDDWRSPRSSEVGEKVLNEKHNPIFVFVDVHPDLVRWVQILPAALSSQQPSPLVAVCWAYVDRLS